MTDLWVPSRARDLTDVPSSPGVANDGQALVWSQSGSAFVLQAPAPAAHAASHLGGSDDLLATLDPRYGREVTQSGVASAPATGDVAEHILATIPIPANIIGPNGRLHLVAMVGRTNGGTPATATVRVRFGLAGSGLAGTATSTNSQASTLLSQRLEFHLWNIGDTAHQHTDQFLFTQGGGAVTAIGVPAIDTTQATELNITGQLGNAGDSIYVDMYSLLVYPHA